MDQLFSEEISDGIYHLIDVIEKNSMETLSAEVYLKIFLNSEFTEKFLVKWLKEMG